MTTSLRPIPQVLRRLTTQALVAVAATLGVAASSSPAEAKFVFPYNHPDLDWYTIETEHFYVHYPVSKKTAEEGNDHYINAEWSARKSAKIAEEMYEPMCAEFNYFIKEKVHIVILDQSDELEGFTIPSWDWIEISAHPGSYFYRMRGRMEWFSDVLVHEYAHVVSLKANSSFAEGTGGISIGGLYDDGIRDQASGGEFNLGDGEPFWWTEGGAEYWSDNTGYNWWSSSRDMNIRTTVLEGRLLTYDEWVTRVDKSDWGDGERGYQQGYSMALYLRERFGDETFARFALEYSEGWRANWESVIPEVTGVDARTLYNDWVKWLTDKYTAVYDRVQAEGEVEGFEMTLKPGGWDYITPEDEDEWLEKRSRDREDEREATGTWALEPRFSGDGRYYGYNGNGYVRISLLPESAFYPFSGEYLSDPELLQRSTEMSVALPSNLGGAWDFVPGKDQVVITGTEHLFDSAFEAYTGLTPELDGYDWNQLWHVDLRTYEHKEKGRTYESLTPAPKAGRMVFDPAAVRPIPNTLRGSDPAMSPDGERLVYLEYGDGTMNVVTIKLDGSEKKRLTSFHDGTWFQRPDWSPDGRSIIVSMFRNYQNVLMILDAQTGEMTPITWDSHESFDAHWAADGRIYFSSDPGGIFNIFAYDPKTKEIVQLTNVIGGAQQPWLTPEGNLVYVNFTAHGFKIYGVDRDQWMNKPATHLFNTDIDMGEVKQSLAFAEDFSQYEAVTKPYGVKNNLMAPTVAPLIRFSNNTQTNFGLQGGFQLYMQDFVEKHVAVFQALVGEDTDLLFQYFNQSTAANIMVLGRRGVSKFDFGYALDADNDPATTDDVETYQGKNVQQYTLGAAGVFVPLNSRLQVGVIGQAMQFGFKDTTATRFDPFSVSAGVSGFMTYQTISDYYGMSANPPPGKVINLSYARNFTDIQYKAFYGADVDDGQLLDEYSFNQFDLSYTQHLRVRPIAGWSPFGLLALAQKHRHAFQFNFLGGYVDRNVQNNDEYFAGGRHPYWWGNGALNPNTMFAGYPAGSLQGETMLILSAAYRFPVWTKINKKMGPLYVYDLHAQIIGTAGNLWSYRPPTEPGTYYVNRYDANVAYNPDDVRREIPFVDYSYKNSPVDPLTGQVNPNYLLYDVGAELRLSSALWRGNWNSFMRLSYGFNEIRGINDVNGDNIISTSDSGLGDSFSNETELPGLRVYFGFGTGW